MDTNVRLVDILVKLCSHIKAMLSETINKDQL